MIVLYEYTRQYWIAHDEAGFWLVPAREGGWHEREPFVGRAGELRALTDLKGIKLGCDDAELAPEVRR